MKHYRILICDVNIQKAGHWLSYNQYILDNFCKIEKENPSIHVIFLYNKEASDLIQLNERFKDRAHFLNGTISYDSGFKKRYLTFNDIKNFAESKQIDHLVFMDLDKFQLPIFLTSFKSTISGILFRPHHRIEPPNNSILSILENYFRRYKKKFAEKLLLNKKNVKNIFLLNDTAGATRLNKLYKCNLFKYIPEPIFSYSKNPAFPLEDITEPRPYKYLIFGSMDERKNITNILKAYDLVNFSMDTELLIAGPASTEYVEYLNSLITTLTSIDNRRKKVLIKVAFFSGEEMDYFFSISDVCLLIYKNFFGSSALIGRAASHRVKVIGPNVGLLNEIIHEYNLGITSDPNNIRKIADSLKSIQDFSVEASGFEDFHRKNSPEVYLKTLLEVEG